MASWFPLTNQTDLSSLCHSELLVRNTISLLLLTFPWSKGPLFAFECYVGEEWCELSEQARHEHRKNLHVLKISLFISNPFLHTQENMISADNCKLTPIILGVVSVLSMGAISLCHRLLILYLIRNAI